MRLHLRRNSATAEDNGDFDPIHPVAMVTNLGELFADSLAFLFPMILFFQMEKEGAANVGIEGSLQQNQHNPSASEIPQCLSNVLAGFTEAGC